MYICAPAPASRLGGWIAAPRGFQTIWSATNDPSNRMKGTFPSNLEQATCTAMTDGATYLEIYAADVLNTNATIQKGISVIHDPSGCSP